MDGTRYRGLKLGEVRPVSIPGMARNQVTALDELLEHPSPANGRESRADSGAERRHQYPHALMFFLRGRDR